MHFKFSQLYILIVVKRPYFFLYSDLNHSIVLLSPSSRPTEDWKPNFSLARLVLTQRRGWPLGLVVSQFTVPLKSIKSAIIVTKSLIDTSRPEPRFTGSASLYFSAAKMIPFAASSTYKKSLVGEPSPHTVI